MDLATLGVVIDPTKAQTGGGQVLGVLERIAKAAESTDAKISNIGKVAGTTATTTSGHFDRMKNSAGSMFDRMRTGADTMGRQLAGIAQNALLCSGQLGALGGAASGVIAAFSGTLPIVLALTAALAALAVVGASIRFGDQMTQATGKIQAATKDLQATQAVYQSIYETALRTGGSVNESAGSFVRFSIAARSIGATHREVLQLVETIQKAGVVSGASTQELSGATFQLSQALASGRLSGDELRAVLEGMPSLAEKLAKELGVSIGQLRTMGAEGKLTSEVVFPALLRTTAEIRKEFENMPPTLGRGFASLSTAVARLFADIDKASGLSAAIAAGMRDAANAVDELGANLRGLMETQQLGEAIYLTVKLALVDAWKAGMTAWLGLLVGIKDAITAIGVGFIEILQTPTTAQFWAGMGNVLVGQAQKFGFVLLEYAEKATNVIQAGFAAATGGDFNATKKTLDTVTEAKTKGRMAAADATINTGVEDLLPTVKSAMDMTNALLDGTKDFFSLDDDRARLKELQGVRAKGSADEALDRSGGSKVKTAVDPKKEADAAKKTADAYRKMYEDIARNQQSLQDKIDAGQVSMFTALQAGMVMTVNKWGNATQQMAQLGSGIMDTLSTGISGALTAIVTGTKSAGDAFREMAISILNDIAQMIIKLIVQLAIQQAINAITGGATGGTTAAASAIGSLQMLTNTVPVATPAATGGLIYGGSGSKDDVPILAMGGEYVLRKSAVDRLGVEYLHALNAGAQGFAQGGLVGGRMPRGGEFAHRGGGEAVNVNINVDASSQGGGDGGGADRGDDRKQKGENLGRQIETVVIGVIQRERRSGGLLRQN